MSTITTLRTIAKAALALATLTASFAHAFELSESYTPATPYSGTYACISGLDFSTQTWSFELSTSGRYRLIGVDGAGQMSGGPDGELTIHDGPFASDATATTYAMSTLRVSDSNPAIIIRCDFGTEVTDDYCARIGD